MNRLHWMTTLVLSCLFTIVFSISLMTKNIQAGLQQWGQPRIWTIDLTEATQNQIESLQKKLQENSEIENVRFVSQKNFVESFQQNWASMGSDLLKDPEVLQFIPDSFEITVKSDQPEQLKSKILSYENVLNVDAGEEWRQRYFQISKSLNQFSIGFLAILSLGAFFIIAYVIQGSVQKRQKEIEVLELVGATAFDIRKPFLIEGASLGFISGSIAMLATYALLLLIKQIIPASPMIANAITSIVYFSWIEVTGILLFTSGLGGLSSYLYVQKMNTGWASSKKIGSNP